MQTQILLLNINIDLISEFAQNIFCNCCLKMVKKISWSFLLHQTSWVQLLVLKHAESPGVSFYIAILGKISPVVDGKDWQVCGNDGSISVNLRINMIKSWKNVTSSWLYWALRYESKMEIPWARMHGWLLCRVSKARLMRTSPSLMVSKTSHGGCLVKDVFMECYFFVWFGEGRV